MTFEEFWKRNKKRYLKLANSNDMDFYIKLAIHTAAEEAWDIAQSNTVIDRSYNHENVDD